MSSINRDVEENSTLTHTAPTIRCYDYVGYIANRGARNIVRHTEKVEFYFAPFYKVKNPTFTKSVMYTDRDYTLQFESIEKVETEVYFRGTRVASGDTLFVEDGEPGNTIAGTPISENDFEFRVDGRNYTYAEYQNYLATVEAESAKFTLGAEGNRLNLGTHAPNPNDTYTLNYEGMIFNPYTMRMKEGIIDLPDYVTRFTEIRNNPLLSDMENTLH